MFEIDPPNVSIRDLGSLNGTFVNDCIIGQRAPDTSKEDHADGDAPSVALKDGDIVRIGPVLLRIKITTCAATAPCETPANASASAGFSRVKSRVQEDTGNMPKTDKVLALFLRCLGVGSLFTLGAVVMPFS